MESHATTYQQVLDPETPTVVLEQESLKMLAANSRVATLVGCPLEELLGKPLGFLASRDPDAPVDRRRHLPAVVRRENGEEIPVEVACSFMGNGAKPVVVLRIRLRRPGSAGGPTPVESPATPRRAQRGLVEANYNQLSAVDKMASIGLLTAGVAHEIRNPAAYVSSNLMALESYLADFRKLLLHWEETLSGGELETAEYLWRQFKEQAQLDDLLQDLEQILEETGQGVDRIIGISSSLNSAACHGHKEREQLQVRQCLDSSLAMVMCRYKSGLQIREQHKEVPAVTGNASELGQVFLNLLLNAAQATNGEGTVTLQTSSENGWVCVRIADDGPGIPPEILPKIFDPLFTTKEAGEGTGLGLSISKEIIKSHGGDIQVESEPGHGAIFTIRLPTQ